MTGDGAQSERSLRVLSSLWLHSELLRGDRSLEWGVVEEHWAGPISDAQVWRDFGDEAWRRWDLMVQDDLSVFQPEMTMFVSRRLRDLAVAAGWRVVTDDQRAFAVERGSGEHDSGEHDSGEHGSIRRIEAWYGSGHWPRVGLMQDGAAPWVETNDLSAVERVVAGVVRGDSGLAADVPAGQEASTLRWSDESWLTIEPGAPFDQAAVARVLKRAIA